MNIPIIKDGTKVYELCCQNSYEGANKIITFSSGIMFRNLTQWDIKLKILDDDSSVEILLEININEYLPMNKVNGMVQMKFDQQNDDQWSDPILINDLSNDSKESIMQITHGDYFTNLQITKDQNELCIIFKPFFVIKNCLPLKIDIKLDYLKDNLELQPYQSYHEYSIQAYQSIICNQHALIYSLKIQGFVKQENLELPVIENHSSNSAIIQLSDSENLKQDISLFISADQNQTLFFKFYTNIFILCEVEIPKNTKFWRDDIGKDFKIAGQYQLTDDHNFDPTIILAQKIQQKAIKNIIEGHYIYMKDENNIQSNNISLIGQDHQQIHLDNKSYGTVITNINVDKKSNLQSRILSQKMKAIDFQTNLSREIQIKIIHDSKVYQSYEKISIKKQDTLIIQLRNDDNKILVLEVQIQQNDLSKQIILKEQSLETQCSFRIVNKIENCEIAVRQSFLKDNKNFQMIEQDTEQIFGWEDPDKPKEIKIFFIPKLKSVNKIETFQIIIDQEPGFQKTIKIYDNYVKISIDFDGKTFKMQFQSCNDTSDNNATILYRKEFKFQMIIQGIGVSIIGCQTLDQSRKELIYIKIDELILYSQLNNDKIVQKAKIRHISLDNNIFPQVFPVTLSAQNFNKIKQNQLHHIEFEFSKNMNSKRINLFFQIQPTCIQLTSQLITGLGNFILTTLELLQLKTIESNPFEAIFHTQQYRLQTYKNYHPIDTSLYQDDQNWQYFYIEKIQFCGFDIILSLITILNRNQDHQTTLLDNLSDSVGLQLVNTNESKIHFIPFQVNNSYVTVEQFQKKLSNHLIYQVIRAVLQIVGSLNILGNPMSIIRTLFDGLFDFVTMPSKGFLMGPKQGLYGFYRGTRSLIQSILESCFLLLTFVTLNVGNLAVYPTLDQKFIKDRMRDILIQPQDIKQGFIQGANIIQSQFKSSQKKFIQKKNKQNCFYYFKQTSGCIFKPISIFVDSLHKVLLGLKNTVKFDLNQPMIKKSRLPRLMYGSDKYFKEYNSSDIGINQYIQKIKKKGINFEKEILDSKFLLLSQTQNYTILKQSISNQIIESEYLVLTINLIMHFKKQIKSKPIWVIKLNSIKQLIEIENEIEIQYKHEDSIQNQILKLPNQKQKKKIYNRIKYLMNSQL